MDWMNIITQLFEIVIFPLLGVGTIYLINLIRVKIQELKSKKDNELYSKYLTLLEDTIVNCVLATTQTYVSALKSQNKFDAAAQKIAFEMTYKNVMDILADDAKEYLQNAIGDLETFVNNKIEATVLNNK
jgi:hypothetical protein